MFPLSVRAHSAEKRAGRPIGRAAASACLFGLVILAALAAKAQSLPPAPRARVVNVTPTPGFLDEPSIAVNPKNPRELVAAFQVNASTAYSKDGGTHWKIAAKTAPADYRISGDVSVAYDNEGHAFLCYIAFDKLGTENYWGHNATRNGIFVRRSRDGGQTWDRHAAAVISHPTVPGIPFEDKPYLVADNTGSPYAGSLYVGWTEFTLAKSVILFSRSADDGQTWSAPIEISTQEGLPRDDNGSVEGFAGTVGADGTLYAAWADGNSIAFTYSKDGGRSFAPSRKILDVAPPYFKVADVSRANGFPQIAIDPKSNRLYVAWSDYRNGDVDVFVSTSADAGASWSPAVRVNSDALHDGADQFFQWLAVDRATGAANLIFYDRRGDPENKKATVVLARSTDGGRTFANYAWTKKPFDARGDFLGDYTGIAAFNNRVYGIWTEERGAAGKQSKKRRKVRSRSAPERARRHHTIVRVGIADFSRSGGARIISSAPAAAPRN